MLLILDRLVTPVLVCTVDDVAEGGGKGSVELDFGNVFFTACFVHVGIDEALHGVDVEDVARDYVVRVREDLGSQRLVQVLTEVIHLEKQRPVESVCSFYLFEFSFAVPFVTNLLKFIELCLN